MHPVCEQKHVETSLTMFVSWGCCEMHTFWLPRMNELLARSLHVCLARPLFPHRYIVYIAKVCALNRCKPTEFNPNGQLFFNPLVQAMRMIVHFGETLPEKITPEHIISTGLLFLWSLCIFCGMLFCFGIGAATGQSTSLQCCCNFPC